MLSTFSLLLEDAFRLHSFHKKNNCIALLKHIIANNLCSVHLIEPLKTEFSLVSSSIPRPPKS